MICSVCIATYKRPKLLQELLRSVINQVLPVDVTLEIIVVDNDPGGSADQTVRQFHCTGQIRLLFFRQNIKNISITRNIAVRNSTGIYLLFIDDDEVACPDWIVKLLRTLKEYDADGVFGPVMPRFDQSAPEWMKKGVLQLSGTVLETATGTEAKTMWSGNCLVRASLLRELEGPFDPEYGITGGEDSELFAKLNRRGAKFVYCREAYVFEYWPSERMQASYLVKRGLRWGNTHTRRSITNSNRKILIRLFLLVKSIFYGLISTLLMIVCFPNKISRVYWKTKIASNIGRFMAVFGKYCQAYK